MKPIKIGPYTTQKELGKGNFGRVYLARKEGTTELFAIKEIPIEMIRNNQKLLELLQTEIHIMKSINHPNILHLFEYLQTKKNYYLVINYCNGGDLEHLVKVHQRLPEWQAVYFLKQILNGFAELHKHHIMHRDFKLANIFLHNGMLVIGDFGLAKSGAQLTCSNVGTPVVMAPEVLLGESQTMYSNKADLWSIGVCFFQMLFGRLPWDIQSHGQLLSKVRNESGANLTIPNSPPTSQECKMLLRAMLEPDQRRRINWDDLYNHPIFQLPQNVQIPPDSYSPDQVQDTNDRFNINRKLTQSSIELEPDCTKIKFEPEETTSAIMSSSVLKSVIEDTQSAISEAKPRFEHETNIIKLILHTCKLLRNQSKEKALLPSIGRGFLRCAILLGKQALMIAERCKLSTSDNSYFKLSYFGAFLNSDVCKLIHQEMEAEEKLCHKIFNHLQRRGEAELGSQGDEHYKMLKDEIFDNPFLENGEATVKEKLDEQIRFVLGSLLSSKPALSPKQQKEVDICIAYSFICANYDTKLAFSTPPTPEGFDWKNYGAQMTVKYVRALASEAFSHYKI